MKSSFASLICWLLLAQTSPAQSLFEKPNLSVVNSLGRYEVFKHDALGDVVFRTVEIPPKTGAKYALHLAYTANGKRDAEEMNFEAAQTPMRVTATLIDLDEGGKNNTAPQIKITLSQGDKIQYRRVNFPPGYGIKRSQVLDPASFHMKWTMVYLYETKGKPDPIVFEIKIERAE